MPSKASLEATWTKHAHDILVGRKIVAVRYLTDEEKTSMRWEHKALVFMLDDGTIIYPSSDVEGNDAGALQIENKETADLIPPI